MKIKSLQIKNIGKIEDEMIEFNKSLNLFYGEILQGKTTILNAVKLCFGGSFSNDLIRHGESDAMVLLKFDNGSIKRTFYIAKDGIIKDRAIEFISDGEVVKKPTDAIKQLLNPFLLDQNFLINKSINDMTKYFIDLLDIDTSELDKANGILVTQAKELRSDIKAAGDLELEVVDEPGKEDDLIEKKQKIVSQLLIKDEYVDQIRIIEEAKEELDNMPQPDDKKKTLDEYKKERDDINSEISNHKADKILYDQYLKDKEKVDKKNQNKVVLDKNTKLQKENQKKKIKLLTEISKNCKIKDLEFDIFGNIIFQETAIDMLSTSQLMNLSSECSGLYPEGLGLELIDHAESLGFASNGSSREAVSVYVDRANKENKTILATIVGENPSNLPNDVGVFIVKSGQILLSKVEEDREDQL